MYGNLDNMIKALCKKYNTDVFNQLVTEKARRDRVLIDEALHLIESYKDMGVADYDKLMVWITNKEKDK